MADRWDALAERADELSDSLYFNLEKGEKAVVVFIGEPHPKEVIWTGDRYVEVGSPEGKELLERGKKPTFKALLNVFIPAEEAIKIFEMSAPTFRILFKLRQKYGLRKYSFEIEKQSKSKYSILPDDPLSESERTHMAQLELHNLAEMFPDADDSDFDSYSKEKKDVTAGNVPHDMIDSETHEELTTRLKQLPRLAIDRFLKTLGVERVRDLPADKRIEAFEALESLERSGVNPFE